MNQAFDAAVCIGRFQLFHNGQMSLLQQALALAPRCIVVIGSAYQARSPRNPFTCEERADLIRLALPEADRERVEFVPVRDYYDQDRWVGAVRAGVGKALGAAAHGARLALVGHHKDATSAYLDDFPGWTLVDVGSQGALHAKALRAALFAADDLEAALAAIQSQVPAATVQFLRAWCQLPTFSGMREEWRAIDAEQRKWAHSPYPPVLVTVDAVVRMADHVLLIRRGRAPGKGLLALPGGFIEPRETVYQSALRELQEETGFKLFAADMRAALKAVRVFDHPDRSQRGRVITHAHYFAFGEGRLPEIAGADDAADARWVPMMELPSLEEQFHEDHYHILDAMLGPL
jgi:bifunctional NMN adenylyltransferase/nudix hydrolase